MFKKGDIVKCISNSDLFIDSKLKLGNHYIVDDVVDDFGSIYLKIKIKEKVTILYSISRFVNITRQEKIKRLIHV